MTIITPESIMSERNSVKSESPDESLPTTPRTSFIAGEESKDKTASASTAKIATTAVPPKSKKHKSRNGCITCKKKRLKCDETHPSCNNCNNKGIVCGGYTVAFKWKSFEDSSSGFKSNPPKKERSKSTAIPMDTSSSMPIKTETIEHQQSGNKANKINRSLSMVDSNVLQKALEDATLSVTGKSYQEVAIANALIASGRNPDLAAAVAKTLNENNRSLESESPLERESTIAETKKEAVSSSSNQYHDTENDNKKAGSLDSLATAALQTHEYQHTALSPFTNNVPEFFFQRNNQSNAPSPSAEFANAQMSPHLQDILRGFESGEVGTPELLDSFNQNLIKNKTDNALSPAPSGILNGFASPRFSTLMKSFTNFDPAVSVPSPANLDISANDFNSNRKRRFSEVSAFSSISQREKRYSNDNRDPVFPSSVLISSGDDTDPATTYEPLSPTNSNASNNANQLSMTPAAIPHQVELSDERMRMLAGFDRYTCGLMSIREGNDNPWRTVMIPMAKEHTVLFNVFSAMTCFHIARGDEELRSQGIKYMRNTVIELARGLSDGSMPPEVALVTCLCLQNSETWDRQTSTGIAHLKGAKSMLIEILKNIQNGGKFLLDKQYKKSDGSSPMESGNNSKKDKYGLLVDNHGKLVLQRKIPKNLLFLFNSFVYFDALARLTSESNDDIYADQGNSSSSRKEKDSDSAIVSDDGSDSEDDSDSALRRMKSSSNSASPMKASSSINESRQSAEVATSFIELFNTINHEGHDIDPLLGCAHSLFPIIGRTAILTTRVKNEGKNSLSIVSQAVAIKYELEQWQPPTVFNLRQGEDADLTSCVSTAEAYRYATLIYLHQAVPEIPSKSSHELATKVLMLLASIPTSSRTCITHIFPLLVASCEATPGDERVWVLEKWDLLIRKMWIGNIDRSLEIVKECWIRRDMMTKRKNKRKEEKESDGVEKLASKIAGYVASAQGERQTPEEDLSISGIKSWCHWRTIMKEWGWEVFLG